MRVLTPATINAYATDPPVKQLLIDSMAVQNALTAFATGGQTNATQLTAGIARVTTCVTIADSVKLPRAVAGMTVAFMNSGATSCNVFPSVGDAINAIAVNGAYAVAAAKSVLFFSPADSLWMSILTA